MSAVSGRVRKIAAVAAGLLIALGTVTVQATEQIGNWDPIEKGSENYTYTVNVYAGKEGYFSSTGTSQKSFTVPAGSNFSIDMNDLVVNNPEQYYPRGMKIAGHDNDEISTRDYRSYSWAKNADGTGGLDGDYNFSVAYGIAGGMVKYKVNYVDASGKPLEQSEEYYGMVGDKPVVSYKYVSGYRPNAYNQGKTLTATESDNVFTFTYSQIPQPTPAATQTTTTTAIVPAGTAPAAGTNGTTTTGTTGSTGTAGTSGTTGNGTTGTAGTSGTTGTGTTGTAGTSGTTSTGTTGNSGTTSTGTAGTAGTTGTAGTAGSTPAGTGSVGTPGTAGSAANAQVGGNTETSAPAQNTEPREYIDLDDPDVPLAGVNSIEANNNETKIKDKDGNTTEVKDSSKADSKDSSTSVTSGSNTTAVKDGNTPSGGLSTGAKTGIGIGIAAAAAAVAAVLIKMKSRLP